MGGGLGRLPPLAEGSAARAGKGEAGRGASSPRKTAPRWVESARQSLVHRTPRGPTAAEGRSKRTGMPLRRGAAWVGRSGWS